MTRTIITETVIIASNDIAVYEEVGRALEGASPTFIVDLKKAQDAANKVDIKNTVLVLDARLPETPSAPFDPSESTALSFLKELRANGIMIPVVVVISRTMGTSDADRSDIEKFCIPENKAIALPRGRLTTPNALAGLIGMLRDPSVKAWDVIEIDVKQKSVKCLLRDRLGETTIEWAEASIPKYFLPPLAFKYKTLNLSRGWSKQIHLDGSQLFEGLIGKTLGLALFSHLENAAGGLNNLAFRFRIDDPSLFTAPFEATVRLGAKESSPATDPDLDTDPFVLIHAPVSRRMGASRWTDPPTAIGRPAKVLFIRSQMGEHSEGPTESDLVSVPQGGPTSGARRIIGEFPPLNNIDLERDVLLALQLERPQTFALDVADLAKRGDATSAEAVLTKAMDGTEYDIVHFAGHSWTTEDQKSTVLILPGRKPGEAEGMDVHRFADAAAKCRARLVYLSSCRGSSATTVANLAQRNIPHVIGFRWDVEDDRAADFAREFYTAVFATPQVTISSAFRTACSRVYPAQLGLESTPIWASPILATLSDNWTRQGVM